MRSKNEGLWPLISRPSLRTRRKMNQQWSDLSETTQSRNRKKKSVFSLMVLKKELEWSESSTFDTLYFQASRSTSEKLLQELDTMWMVGFIHHSKTTIKNLVSAVQATLLIL